VSSTATAGINKIVNIAAPIASNAYFILVTPFKDADGRGVNEICPFGHIPLFPIALLLGVVFCEHVPVLIV
jgi:hypothetical protein